MATGVRKTWKPLRGKKQTAIDQNLILENGEVFFEASDSGVGRGSGKIKMGDGVTKYQSLPYFISNDGTGGTVTDITECTAIFTESSTSTNDALLAETASGSSSAILFGAIKKLLRNLSSSVSTLETSFRNGCSTIAAAITAKGVTTASNASPETMAANIAAIATGMSSMTELTNGGAKYHTDNGLTKTINYTLPDTSYSAYLIVMSTPLNESVNNSADLSSMSITGHSSIIISDVSAYIGVLGVKASPSAALTITATMSQLSAGYFGFYYRIFGIN